MGSAFKVLGSLLLLSSAAISVAIAQQSATEQPAQKSLGDLAKEQRARRDGAAQPAAPATQQAPVPQASEQSLGEIASRQKAKQRMEVKVTESDVKRLSTEMDEILQ